MNNRPFFFALFFLLTTTACALADTYSILDTRQIEILTGLKGGWNEGSTIFKVSAPRTHVKVSAAGVKITPDLGLTSWATFKFLNPAV